jgi:hypothetical protein
MEIFELPWKQTEVFVTVLSLETDNILVSSHVHAAAFQEIFTLK